MQASRLPLLLSALFSFTASLFAQTDPGVPDLTTRETARTWFNSNWAKTTGAAMNFTGNVLTGDAGDTSTAFREQALLRYNMFRRMVGAQPFVLDATKNHTAQLAAMVIAANGKMAHGIDSSWKFYSEEANRATENCNEALDDQDPTAAWGYLYDFGPMNVGVLGHRQDMLAPWIDLRVGLGNVPATATTKKAQAMAIDAFAGDTPSAFDKPLVLWPAAGYVPNYLITGQWSATVPDKLTTFALTLVDAKISVTRNGVPLTTKGKGQTSGEGAIWTIDGTADGSSDYGWFSLSNGEQFYGRPNFSQDIVYHVVIEGIRLRVPKTYYGYSKDGQTAVYDNMNPAYGTLVISWTEDDGTGALYNGTGRYEYDVIGYNPDLRTTMQVVTQPASQVANAGGLAALYVEATGVSGYQWYKDGVAIAGATQAWLQFPSVKTRDAGRYNVLMTGSGGAMVSSYATLSISAGSPVAQRLVNLSTRSIVGTGDQIQIAGFVVSGTKPKTVLLRASGPALAGFGVSGTLADPVLSLFDADNKQVATNDDWSSDATKAAVIATAASNTGAFAWTKGSKDAAILITLQPGRYTAQIAGKDAGTGIALIEVYDLGDGDDTHLANISSRTLVKTGDDVQIAGFVISGTTPKTVLLRASGPALDAFGVSGTLADPVLSLHDAAGTKLQSNDDWSTDSAQAALITAAANKTGAFAWVTGSKDAALLVTLQPGRYSAQVAGKNSGVGVAIIEIYEVP